MRAGDQTASPLREAAVGMLGWAFAAAVGAAPATVRQVYEVPRTAGEVRVDGRLDEAAWESAALIEARFETHPGNNTPAPVRTVARLMYDPTTLYVGIEALDPEPGKIRAHYSARDTAFLDDFVGIIIDTFDDARRGYEFFVNPLGVQMDLVVNDITGNEDESWDAIWSSAGRMTPEGFVVEMAIPFAQLRFPRGGRSMTWGLDVARVWPRDRRFVLNSQPRNRDLSCYLCQISRISGFAGAVPGRNIELDPTLTATAWQARADLPHGALSDAETDVEAGVTARWGVTPNLTLSTAVNPDFSHVEADAGQLDVNRQFALFFAERRPFFLEGADTYDTPIDAVYTRTVADPVWGAKITGKEGRHTIGVYAARDDVTNILLPGAEGSDLTSLAETGTSGVARYRLDIGATSSLGVLATGRRAGDYSNGVAGLDTKIRLGPADTVEFQFLSSATEYPEAIREEFGQPGGTLSGQAFAAEYDHTTRDWSWDAEFESYDRGFRADSGFVPQVGYREGRLALERRWWGTPGDRLSQIELGGEWDRSEDSDGNLLEEELEAWLSLSGPRQSYLNLGAGVRERGYRGEAFDQWFVNLNGSARPNSVFEVEVAVNAGNQLDYANVRNGDRLRLAPYLTWKPGRHLSLSLSHAFELLDVEAGRLYTANLTEMRAAYQFGTRTFVRWISQYTEVERDPALYGEHVERREREWFNQLLFSYTLNPQTVVFAGYSDARDGLGDGANLALRDRTFFVKLGYAWLL
ncbi:MAG: DUF5916 domain-containing protein [Acidobacteriota bacterium]